MTVNATGNAARPPRFIELRELTADGRLLFITRMVRLFAYGFLSVVLVLYLSALGLTDQQIGLLLTLTLLGDAVISLWITTQADRIGRKRMLLAGSALMILAGVLFAVTRFYPLLVLAATIGVISPSGNEVGPFLALEQAALSHTVPDRRRTGVFAWYNLVGSVSTALGALAGGGLAQLLQSAGWAPAASYKVIVLGYALLGGVLVLLFLRLSAAIEAELRQAAPGLVSRYLGLDQSRSIVLKLSALFSLDAFAGGFVVQSIVAYWFYRRYGVEPALLGAIFFGANVLAGLSALSAVWVAQRVGLLRTMVVTHLPSNILLILVPLMPNLPLAITMLLLRFSISQMDVPTRQSYTMAVVPPNERASAAGVTGIARTLGAAVAPALAVALMANPALMAAPFLISGGLKIVYDLLIYGTFRHVTPPEEAKQ
ncbi:MAG: MFS transporter [Anaerolineales bacterium]